MRVAIATRIYSPEPSAASFRLEALATAFAEAGHDVTVLTVKAPEPETFAGNAAEHKVKRFPVLRDKTGYVRGYLQYMSFDVPLFSRLLFSKRFDAIVVEPPPTTGFVVRMVAALTRTPYFYYAADIWSDAATQAGAATPIVKLLRSLEKFALKGARGVFSVSSQVSERLNTMATLKNVHTIGNGFNSSLFQASEPELSNSEDSQRPMFVYTGTASQLHGAEIFVRALPKVLMQLPDARIRFIGGGTEKENMQKLAADLKVDHAISFEESVSPAELAKIMASTTAALASLRPGFGYDFAFPTKLYTAASFGNYIIFTGTGPAEEFARSIVNGETIGVGVAYNHEQVAGAMIASVSKKPTQERKKIVSAWAKENYSLETVAKRAVKIVEELNK